MRLEALPLHHYNTQSPYDVNAPSLKLHIQPQYRRQAHSSQASAAARPAMAAGT